MERITSHTPFLSHFRWPAADFERKKRVRAEDVLDPNKYLFKLQGWTDGQITPKDTPIQLSIVSPNYNPWEESQLPPDPQVYALQQRDDADVEANYVRNTFEPHDTLLDEQVDKLVLSHIPNPYDDNTLDDPDINVTPQGYKVIYLPNYEHYPAGSGGVINLKYRQFRRNPNFGKMIVNKDDPKPRWDSWIPVTPTLSMSNDPNSSQNATLDFATVEPLDEFFIEDSRWGRGRYLEWGPLTDNPGASVKTALERMVGETFDEGARPYRAVPTEFGSPDIEYVPLYDPTFLQKEVIDKEVNATYLDFVETNGETHPPTVGSQSRVARRTYLLNPFYHGIPRLNIPAAGTDLSKYPEKARADKETNSKLSNPLTNNTWSSYSSVNRLDYFPTYFDPIFTAGLAGGWDVNPDYQPVQFVRMNRVIELDDRWAATNESLINTEAPSNPESGKIDWNPFGCILNPWWEFDDDTGKNYMIENMRQSNNPFFQPFKFLRNPNDYKYEFRYQRFANQQTGITFPANVAQNVPSMSLIQGQNPAFHFDTHYVDRTTYGLPTDDPPFKINVKVKDFGPESADQNDDPAGLYIGNRVQGINKVPFTETEYAIGNWTVRGEELDRTRVDLNLFSNGAEDGGRAHPTYQKWYLGKSYSLTLNVNPTVNNTDLSSVPIPQTYIKYSAFSRFDRLGVGNIWEELIYKVTSAVQVVSLELEEQGKPNLPYQQIICDAKLLVWREVVKNNETGPSNLRRFSFSASVPQDLRNTQYNPSYNPKEFYSYRELSGPSLLVNQMNDTFICDECVGNITGETLSPPVSMHGYYHNKPDDPDDLPMNYRVYMGPEGVEQRIALVFGTSQIPVVTDAPKFTFSRDDIGETLLIKNVLYESGTYYDVEVEIENIVEIPDFSRPWETVSAFYSHIAKVGEFRYLQNLGLPAEEDDVNLMTTDWTLTRKRLVSYPWYTDTNGDVRLTNFEGETAPYERHFDPVKYKTWHNKVVYPNGFQKDVSENNKQSDAFNIEYMNATWLKLHDHDNPDPSFNSTPYKTVKFDDGRPHSMNWNEFLGRFGNYYGITFSEPNFPYHVYSTDDRPDDAVAVIFNDGTLYSHKPLRFETVDNTGTKRFIDYKPYWSTGDDTVPPAVDWYYQPNPFKSFNVNDHMQYEDANGDFLGTWANLFVDSDEKTLKKIAQLGGRVAPILHNPRYNKPVSPYGKADGTFLLKQGDKTTVHGVVWDQNKKDPTVCDPVDGDPRYPNGHYIDDDGSNPILCAPKNPADPLQTMVYLGDDDDGNHLFSDQFAVNAEKWYRAKTDDHLPIKFDDNFVEEGNQLLRYNAQYQPVPFAPFPDGDVLTIPGGGNTVRNPNTPARITAMDPNGQEIEDWVYHHAVPHINDWMTVTLPSGAWSVQPPTKHRLVLRTVRLSLDIMQHDWHEVIEVLHYLKLYERLWYLQVRNTQSFSQETSWDPKLKQANWDNATRAGTGHTVAALYRTRFFAGDGKSTVSQSGDEINSPQDVLLGHPGSTKLPSNEVRSDGDVIGTAFSPYQENRNILCWETQFPQDLPLKLELDDVGQVHFRLVDAKGRALKDILQAYHKRIENGFKTYKPDASYQNPMGGDSRNGPQTTPDYKNQLFGKTFELDMEYTYEPYIVEHNEPKHPQAGFMGYYRNTITHNN
ncbi:MAG: hypothetical protein CL859_07320 [Cyanobium sp. ARS6]|nr:hypothetical protein [Cyanobium sp. ARS6]|tara:strand:- start:3134 stop:8101 length:4968 start_codon:yes stop_codon:yes gene_type:complete